jgi:O-antigen/teichoic acid export membrane protein
MTTPDLRSVEVPRGLMPAQRKRARLGMRALLRPAAGAGGKGPLASASMFAFGIFVAGAGLTYAAQLLLARVLGPDSYGIYAYVLAWITLLGYLSTLGFHTSLLRLVPAHLAKEEWPFVAGVLRSSMLMSMLVGTVVAALGILIVLVLGDLMRREVVLTFVLGFVAVPVLALHLVGASAVRGFGGVLEALVPERLFRDGLLISLTAVLALSGSVRLDAATTMSALVVSSIGTLALVQYYLRGLRPPEMARHKPEYLWGEWCRPAAAISVLVLADNLMNRCGILVLGVNGRTREAGVFAVAYSLALLPGLPRMAVATIFAPAVSDLHVRGENAALQQLTTRASRLSLMGTSAVALPLVGVGPYLLSWFGMDFAASYPVMLVLLLAQVVGAGFGPQQHLITMTGNERMGAVIYAGCTLANLLISFVAVGAFGMVGAAVATTLSMITWNVIMAIFIRKRLGLTTSPLGVRAP